MVGAGQEDALELGRRGGGGGDGEVNLHWAWIYFYRFAIDVRNYGAQK